MRQRLVTYRGYVREQLEAAFGEDHPATDIALSFSLGLFVAALPNFGIALVLFAALIRYVDRVSSLALLAVLVIMNPPVKWAIYAAGFWLGSRLLGPVPGISVTEFSIADLSLSVGPEVFIRVFVGSFCLAAVIAVVSYVAAIRFIKELRQREIELVDKLPETFSD
ncbi:DUF2062 domain-containing protein [Halohasta litorea]|uniref:DUF2062 domain-containing protein n=1 Tax=Halohasta litorea TaxID=869891 RepID=A0ABD6D6I3_9EURY|nr:DUF2062 domain-containing protein [Halohasta litorea]